MQLGAYLPEALRSNLYNTLYYQPAIRRYGLRRHEPGLFASIFFEVVTRCNSRCHFCSASIQNEKRPFEEMPFELFAKAMDELAELGYGNRVAFHVNNEPLLFSGLESFIACAREKLPRCRLQVMTNGLLLTPKRGASLIQAGLDELVIDFYREKPGQKLYKNLAAFLTETLPSLFTVQKGDSFSNGNDAKTFTCKVIYRQLGEVLTSRGGSAPNKAAARKTSGFCIYPWRQFNVTADGRVNKCCSDFHFADPMGDMKQQGIMEIWHGQPFARVREQLWQGLRSELPNCSQCDFFGLKNAHIANPVLRAVKYNCLKRN